MEEITPEKTKPPRHYYEGNRLQQIFHCRLRANNADLNANLFTRNLAMSPNCTCGAEETTDHYLLECQNYKDERAAMIIDISHCNVTAIDIEILLKGCPTLSDSDNKTLFLAVQEFIGITNRFT